jgi:ribonuclease HI
VEIHIYCDGSTGSNGASGRIGYAAVLLLMKDGQVAKKREVCYSEERERATNNLAELLAVKAGLTALRPEALAKAELTIVSDSQWAIGALSGAYKKVSHHLELIGEIRALLQQSKSHRFEWVRGHVGDLHNERANSLAQQASGVLVCA